MADVELRRHQETWHGFTTLIKLSLGAILTIVVLMALFLV